MNKTQKLMKSVVITVTQLASTNQFNYVFAVTVGGLTHTGKYSRGHGHGEWVMDAKKAVKIRDEKLLVQLGRMYRLHCGKNADAIDNLNKVSGSWGNGFPWGTQYVAKSFNPLEILSSLLVDAQCFSDSIDIDDFKSNFMGDDAKVSAILDSWESCKDTALFLYRVGFNLSDLHDELEKLDLV